MYLIAILQDSDHAGLFIGFQSLLENPKVAENIVSLLNKVLLNKHPNFSISKTIQVQELLSWNAWPDIIKTFGKNLNISMYIITCSTGV